jgi:PPOX class probable F420-dependent enzyme
MPTGQLTGAMRAFLEEIRFATIATINADGSPQVTTMWYLIDGDDIVFNTARGRAKDVNLRRDPRASFLVHEAYTYVRVSGRVRTIEDPTTAQEDIKRLAIRYHGREAGERQARESFSKQDRISYRLPIRRVYAGGF